MFTLLLLIPYFGVRTLHDPDPPDISSPASAYLGLRGLNCTGAAKRPRDSVTWGPQVGVSGFPKLPSPFANLALSLYETCYIRTRTDATIINVCYPPPHEVPVPCLKPPSSSLLEHVVPHLYNINSPGAASY